MKRGFFITVGALFATVAWAQVPTGSYGYTGVDQAPTNANSSATSQPVNVKLANLSQDTQSNQKDIQELSLRVEQLERDKAALEAKVNAPGNYATKDDLKLTEARLTQSMNDTVTAANKKVEADILDQIKAAKRSTVKADTTATAATLPAKSADKSSGNSAATTSKIPVSDAEKAAYMKDGIRYTVQPGDSISSIARHYKSSVRAIMVANDISSPNKLFVGRELFVPSLDK